MILSICNSPSILEIIKIVRIIITVILIVVPSVLMFSLIFKFISAATKGDDDAIAIIKKKAVPNIVAAALIFLIPTIVSLLVQVSFPNSEYSQCLGNSNSDTISGLYYDDALAKLNLVKQTLLLNDYYNAESKIEKVNDDTQESLLEKLRYLKPFVDIMTEIRQLRSSKSYAKLSELRVRVESINDQEIKEVLLNELEKISSGLMIFEPILPNSDETIIKQEETDTLKVYITQKGKYYLTRIWAINPYEQLNKRDASPYGSVLERPGNLLKKEITDKGMNNKLVLGFNASGFYLKDTYDPNSVKYYSGYNKTSVGTIVITDGKVVRNQWEKGDLLTWFIAGVNPDNQMVVFVDKKMKETNKTEKKAWSESVINSGIRNTYTFAAPVILDGQKTNYNNHNSRMPGDNEGKKGLQMLCQINNNNFVLFTSSNESRNTGINIFYDLGCQTAVNLDGGGSVALLFKSSNSSSIETIVGNGRSLPEVGYFSE